MYIGLAAINRSPRVQELEHRVRVLAIALLTSTADSDMSTLLECLRYVPFALSSGK